MNRPTQTPSYQQGAGGFAGDTLALSLSEKSNGWAAPALASKEAPSPRGWYAYASVPSTGAFLVYGGLAPDNSRWVFVFEVVWFVYMDRVG